MTTRINFYPQICRYCFALQSRAYLMTGRADLATKDINRIRERSNLAHSLWHRHEPLP